MPPQRHSRHLFTAGVIDSDDSLERLHLTDREKFRYKDRSDNIRIRVVEGDTLFSIADTVYEAMPRAAGLWWVIADYQPDPIHDPTVDLEPGRLIIAPSFRVLIEEVFSDERQAEA